MDAAHDGHIRRIHIENVQIKGNRTKLWRSPPKGIRPWDHLLKPSPPSAICWRPCFTAGGDQADEESLDPKPSSDRVWAGTTPPCRPVGSKRLAFVNYAWPEKECPLRFTRRSGPLSCRLVRCSRPSPSRISRFLLRCPCRHRPQRDRSAEMCLPCRLRS